MREDTQQPLKTWLAYFQNNSRSLHNIDWNANDTLSGGESSLIGKSIAAFQLGEYSEGRGLLKSAEEYSKNFGNNLLFEITQLFIKEEQNHALLLKRFMVSHNIKLLRKHWTDTVFRKLRKVFNYELSITVLITAEIIALVYYKALKSCTASKILKAICDKILADEKAHVKYESEMILYIRRLKPLVARQTLGILHCFLFFGTVIVVYFDHRNVLNRSGYGFTRFWKSCWHEFSTCFSRNGAHAKEAVEVTAR